MVRLSCQHFSTFTLVAYIRARCPAAKAKKGPTSGGITRVDFMLETLADLKNNKLKMQDKDVNINVQRIRKMIEGNMKERFGVYSAPDTIKIAWSDLISDKKSGTIPCAGLGTSLPQLTSLAVS
jgi:hypothetical protein